MKKFKLGLVLIGLGVGAYMILDPSFDPVGHTRAEVILRWGEPHFEKGARAVGDDEASPSGNIENSW